LACDRIYHIQKRLDFLRVQLDAIKKRQSVVNLLFRHAVTSASATSVPMPSGILDTMGGFARMFSVVVVVTSIDTE
jgi:hypothetical protein